MLRNGHVSCGHHASLLLYFEAARSKASQEGLVHPRLSIGHPTRISVRIRPCSPIPPDLVLARFALIPLSLLYSSMSKLFLLFLLSIWRPSSKPSSALSAWTSNTTANIIISTALGIMDDDKLDREWIVRNVLGGMSAGFGLRGAFASTFPYIETWLFKI